MKRKYPLCLHRAATFVLLASAAMPQIPTQEVNHEPTF